MAELQHGLAARRLPLLARTGAMPQVLQSLRRESRESPLTHLVSHEETGHSWSYARFLAVAE